MAEQYPTGDATKSTVVTREGAQNGAEVYPEPRRHGFPWWILLLGLIPLLLLMFRNRDNNTGTTATPVAVVSASPSAVDPTTAGGMAATGTDTQSANSAALPPTTGIEGKDVKVYKGSDITVAPEQGASKKGEPLTDVVAFASVANKSSLIDRKVKLTNVNVVRVLSDRAFIVGPRADQSMVVLLDNRLDAGTSGEKVSLAEGKAVSLTGILKAADAQSLESQYGISAADTTSLAQEPVYLHATIAQEK